jgi:DNA-binding MurR/RpiR family transcriptional regulator
MSAFDPNVAYCAETCNIHCMSKRAAAPSPLAVLCNALPTLPTRLQEVGRFVAANDFDATTRSMRELAAVAGADPASFTRLAQALGYSGWDELRHELIEARRPLPATPFSERVTGRAKVVQRGSQDLEQLIELVLGSDVSGLGRIEPSSVAIAARALHGSRRIWVAGFRSCRSVAELLSYQLRLFRADDVRLVAGCGPEDLDFGAFRSDDAVVVFGFAPYSRASVVTARAARQVGSTLIAIADTPVAPMAEGADHLLLFEAAFSPGFFPSLTGAIAIAQALAAAAFAVGGASARKCLKDSEARLAATSQYVAQKGTTA